MQRLGGAPEAAVVGDRDEGLQAEHVELHALSSSIGEINSFYFDPCAADTGPSGKGIEDMDPIDDAWRALRAGLEARAGELAEEVRRYPGPIARCDDQLPALLAERSRALELARLAADLERERPALDEIDWLARLSQLAWLLQPRDEASRALHANLVEALRRRSTTPASSAR